MQQNTFTPKDNNPKPVNIYNSQIVIPQYFAGTKPLHNSESISGILDRASTFDCYLPWKVTNTNAPATEEQIKSYMLSIFASPIPQHCLSLDIVEYSVCPFSRNTIITVEFYELNPQLYHPVIAEMFFMIKAKSLSSESFLQISAFIPYLNSPTLSAIYNHAYHYEVGNGFRNCWQRNNNMQY